MGGATQHGYHNIPEVNNHVPIHHVQGLDLMELVNNIDVARVDGSTANFSGSGKGNNQIGALDAKHGSTLNFSQLMNLVNSVDVARVDGSTANFNGSG